jgi:hypothetical protein
MQYTGYTYGYCLGCNIKFVLCCTYTVYFSQIYPKIIQAIPENPCCVLGRGIAILVVGMIPRLLMVFLVVSRNNLERKEKIFLMLSWIPKATVQVKQGS